VLWVDVINIRPNGDIYLLKEDRQEFHGRLKPKRRKLQSSIGEKLKPGEDPAAAVKSFGRGTWYQARDNKSTPSW